MKGEFVLKKAPLHASVNPGVFSTYRLDNSFLTMDNELTVLIRNGQTGSRRLPDVITVTIDLGDVEDDNSPQDDVE